MGTWKNASKAGARKAVEAGLSVRLTASGHQVWIEPTGNEEAPRVEGAVTPSVQALLVTPVDQLAGVLAEADDMDIVRAAARDDRTTARPLYRKALGEGNDD